MTYELKSESETSMPSFKVDDSEDESEDAQLDTNEGIIITIALI